MPECISKLIRCIADGWDAPLEDSENFKVTVHRDGVFLSGPELVDNNKRREELVRRFPEATAIEMEGEGEFWFGSRGGGGGCWRATQVLLYGEGPPRGLNPCPFIYQASDGT